MFITDMILPYLYQFDHLKTEYIITAQHDDLIIDSLNEKFIETRSSSPFSAYYFLIVIVFFTSKLKRFLNYIHYYNLFLFIVSPICITILLSGGYWIAPLINAHEVAYKSIFLCIGMLILGKEFILYKATK